ncbi:hypothetical protein D9757_007278 [Collybiopsis confluens]|uniref:PHD-type domain-containing protein n=1 Tax=Collybiopsis confluens TaxID=2823264 RepID=A0A8H5HH09_9AGAR|nr:hypothetical protein D9757_007278 [Collybiopsis confluens]
MAPAFLPASNDLEAVDSHRDQLYQPRTPRKNTSFLPPTEDSGGDLSTSNNDLPAHPRVISNLYSHLPTPQSPNNLASYIPGLTSAPESPMSHFSYSLTSARSLEPPLDSTPKRTPLLTQQIMTPESSPFAGRSDILNNRSTPATPLPRTLPSSSGMESYISLNSPLRKTPSPSPSSEPLSSQLSSPFVAKASIPTKNSRPSSASPNAVLDTAELSLPPISSLMSTPPISPLLPSSSTEPPALAGGELERIHQAMQEQHDVVESRRPEYLKRTKRTLSDSDPTAMMEDDGSAERGGYSSVGIMDSPMKGRRIKLFQETSEESFEESLMAGGYGRYASFHLYLFSARYLFIPLATGAPVNVVAHLEEVQQEVPPPPPTEKELKKRKRLDAFRSSATVSSSRLYPVDIEGKGRVLLDVPTERSDVETAAAAARKRTPGKRKKKAEPTAKERRALAAAAAAEEAAEKPNWPDTEFPWKLRKEERSEQAKAEEEERLKWVEKFLDRDTDDEDDGEGGDYLPHGGGFNDEEVLPSSVWGVVYEDGEDRPVPYRTGRGKMVPLRGDPARERVMPLRRRNAYFPSDPADARAALLSKKSVRELSYRRQRLRLLHRSDNGGEEQEGPLCICQGRDDGREMAQCDVCNTWYHLDCIGIENVTELGAAEDKWFCFRCEPEGDSPPSIDVVPVVPEVEPDFAPTDETPHRRQADAQLYQPESPTMQPWSLSVPQMPKTPTRGVANGTGLGSGFTSSSSSLPSSRNAPVTPRHYPRDVRIVAGSSPGGPYDLFGSDDSHFDPTSTPSRGIKFAGPYATPKNAISAREFQTPSKPHARSGSITSFGSAGFLSSALNERGDDQSPYPYGRTSTFLVEESSPIRREGHRVRRIADASGIAGSRLLFDESPLRTKGKGRALDFGIGSEELA